MEEMSNWGLCVKVTWAGRTGKPKYRNVNRLEITVTGCPGVFRGRVLEILPSDDILQVFGL